MLQARSPRLFYFLLALGCMNFLGRGSIVLLLLFLYELIRRKSCIAVDGNAIAIGCFCLCVIIAAAAYYSYSECIKAANYLLMYLLGFDTFRRAEDKDKCVEHTTLAICVGFGLELVLMYIYNYGREQLTSRSMYSIWTGETVSVTLLGLLVSAVTGYSFYSFFYSNKKSQKILILFLLTVGLIVSVDTATRTPFVLLILVYFVMLTIHIFNKRGSKAIRSVVLSSIVLILIFIFYEINIGGIKTAIQGTPLFQRFQAEAFDSSRLDIMWKHFSLMLDYPWGGGLIENVTGRNAHNYLQQGHDLYGIFAFLFLLLITAQFISNIVKLAARKQKNGTDMLFLSMYLTILIQMCLEPIFTGYPILFWSLLMIHGMATAYLKAENSSITVRSKYKI